MSSIVPRSTRRRAPEISPGAYALMLFLACAGSFWATCAFAQYLNQVLPQ